MLAFLKLIRWNNLLMVALWQCLFRFCLILPLYGLAGYTSSLNPWAFIGLVISTLCICAAGYIINDYYDIEADKINKPERIIIGKQILPKTALTLYGILNLFGISLSLLVGYYAGNYKLGYITILTAALLWFYTTVFKKKIFIGNFVVSILSALSVLLVGIYETKVFMLFKYLLKNNLRVCFEALTGYVLPPSPIIDAYNNSIISTILFLLLGFGLFAFLLSMAREIIKDIEDYEGDSAVGCKTIPIVFGIGAAKLIAAAFVAITILLVTKFQINQFWLKQYTPAYGAFAVLLPLWYVFFKIRVASSIPTHFTLISKGLKIIMAIAALYLIYLKTTISLVMPINNIEVTNTQNSADSLNANSSAPATISTDTLGGIQLNIDTNKNIQTPNPIEPVNTTEPKKPNDLERTRDPFTP